MGLMIFLCNLLAVLVLFMLFYRVHLGDLSEFMTTSCITNLTFLTESEGSPDCEWLIIIIYSERVVPKPVTFFGVDSHICDLKFCTVVEIHTTFSSG